MATRVLSHLNSLFQGIREGRFPKLEDRHPTPEYAAVLVEEFEPRIKRSGRLRVAGNRGLENAGPNQRRDCPQPPVYDSDGFYVLDTYYGQSGTAGNCTLEVNGVNFDRTITQLGYAGIRSSTAA